MRKLIVGIKIFLSTLLLLSIIYHYANAESWEKVASMGFDDPRNDYAWCMETFKGKIYVGTLNGLGGAEIWSSFQGEVGTWKMVYDTRPLSNTGIRCLYNDRDMYLYASSLNLQGAEILRSTDGEIWETLLKNGFGDKRNTTIRCITRFREYLYAGMGNNGAKLYRSIDGSNWTQVYTNPSFESTKVVDPETNNEVTNNVMIGELKVFNGHLYAFTWTMDIDPKALKKIIDTDNAPNPNTPYFPATPGAFEVWRSNDGVNWEKVVGKNDIYDNGLGFCFYDHENLNNDAVTSVTIFKGKLYLGTANSWKKSSIWRTSEGTHWEKVLDFFELGEEYNYYIWRMISFNDRLFIGTMNTGPSLDSDATGAQIWVSDSGETGSFTNLIHNGFDGETITVMDRIIPKNIGIRCINEFKGQLFVGTATIFSIPVQKSKGKRGITIAGKNIGCEIWKMIP